MKNSPAFQLYAQDFLTGVMYLTNEEVGIYIRMLCKQWTDGSIPKKRLGFLVGYDWENLSEELKSKFVENDGRLINTKLEEVRKQKERFLEKQRENGKKGGRRPKNKEIKNPKQSQKKPLEVEVEIEVEDKRDIFLEKYEKPFLSNEWEKWKDYKKKEFGFKYKSQASEQAAIKTLIKLADENPDDVIKIIEQSIANGWKGFFPLQEKKSANKNEQRKQTREERIKQNLS